MLTRYAAATDADVAVVAQVLETESRFVATAALTARAASKVTDVYIYRFSRVGSSSRSVWGGAARTSEVPYVFDNTSGSASQFDEIDRTVSRAMADAWVQFATTGNPDGGGLPQWPAYRSPDYRVLDFGDAVTMRSHARSPEIEFFQQAFEAMRRKASVPNAFGEKVWAEKSENLAFRLFSLGRHSAFSGRPAPIEKSLGLLARV